MGSYMNEGKRPEEVNPICTKGAMQDIHYLLMQQCLRDARSLYRMVEHFDGSNTFLNDWATYEKNVVEMARTLFEERTKNPVTLDQLKQIVAVGESSVETLGEVKFNSEESLRLMQEIEALSTKRESLSKDILSIQDSMANARANNFLRNTVGDSMYESYKTTGKLNIKGTNGATYVIDSQGDIVKKRGGLLGRTTGWQGRVNPGKYPLDDAIATIVVHVRKDSDKFDEEKKCGNISLY